ncbi:Arm DNA-binding domain-containing protein [Methylobacterium aquaticum]|uniref:Arm DNA-binding domain-containing protein n=1 Tax=Methylobacterium aquaticum TaxID=270351 RepID=UPI003D172B07
MPRKAETLTSGGVERLIREARETRAAPRDIADGGCQGLTLRLTPTAAVWSIRFRHDDKPLRIRLGDAREWTLAQARAVAGDLRTHVEAGQGIPANDWIALKRTALAAKGGVDVPAAMPRDRGPVTWTLAEARQAWGAWMRREVEAGLLRDATVRNYLGVMSGPAMRTLDASLVSRITVADVAAVVATLIEQGKRSTARDVVRVSKRFWPWMGDADRKHLSGADPNALAGLKAPKTGDKPTRRSPRVPAIASMLAVAQHGALSTSVGGAIELLIYTAQRRLSVVTARVAEFEPWPEREGWGIWWQGHRTIAQGAPTEDDPRHGSHALPLPPHVWRRIETYLAFSRREAEERGVPRSPWMYPAARPRRIGDPVTHLSPHTLTHAVAAMPGIEASPQDVRRAFATVCQRDLGVAASVVGMVLDHATGDLPEVSDGNPMTRRSTLDQMLALKAPALEAWQKAVWAERLKVELPDREVLKAQIVAENLRQRGVTDLEAEGERRRKAAAKAYAEGRTWRQRRRPVGATNPA